MHPGWPVAQPPRDFEVGHVRAVLPDRVLDDAVVVVRDGRIAEVAPHRPGVTASLDGRGLVCLPGLIDVHSDALARECHPRPGADLPADVALASARGRLEGAGVTTAFHGLAFQARSPVGLPIDSPMAEDLYAAVLAEGGRVLHRVDVRCAEGMARFESTLAEVRPQGGEGPLLVSHEDHTPGQGQYADPATMERWLVRGEGMDEVEAGRHVRWWREVRESRCDLRDANLARLGELAGVGGIRLMGHDPQTTDDVAAMVERGVTVAEFPTTLEAARAAREAGLLVVAGAPNVLRGRSHSGNVSASELIAEGLVDALASDYLPYAMLAAIAVLVRDGAADLPAAVRLVTSGPAAVAGLANDASLVAGARTDLLLVDVSGAWPRAVLSCRAGLR